MVILRSSVLPLVSLLCVAACSSSPGGISGTGAGTTTSTSTASTTSSSSTAMGQPITAPSEQWTWIPFDNAFCGNGSTTGIGVNLTSKSTRVLLYLEGGGACWSDGTCYTLMTASYFTTGYGETDFKSETADATYLALPGGFFDRTAAANPFKDYSYVYVPYCTGDIHAGNNLAKYNSGTGHHVGFVNMTNYLQRIVPTFPTADRVILAGSSAGGFGASYNWWQTQEAFGSVRVDVIDDSGTPMPADVPSAYQSQVSMEWNLASTLPPGCTGCDMDLSKMLGFYIQKFPTHRAALLSYVQDSVLPTFFGISTAQFSMGLQEDINTYIDPASNFKYFTNSGMGHVLFFSPMLTNGAGGTATVQQFVTQMVTDDPSWASVHP